MIKSIGTRVGIAVFIVGMLLGSILSALVLSAGGGGGGVGEKDIGPVEDLPGESLAGGLDEALTRIGEPQSTLFGELAEISQAIASHQTELQSLRADLSGLSNIITDLEDVSGLLTGVSDEVDNIEAKLDTGGTFHDFIDQWLTDIDKKIVALGGLQALINALAQQLTAHEASLTAHDIAVIAQLNQIKTNLDQHNQALNKHDASIKAQLDVIEGLFADVVFEIQSDIDLAESNIIQRIEECCSELYNCFQECPQFDDIILGLDVILTGLGLDLDGNIKGWKEGYSMGEILGDMTDSMDYRSNYTNRIHNALAINNLTGGIPTWGSEYAPRNYAEALLDIKNQMPERHIYAETHWGRTHTSTSFFLTPQIKGQPVDVDDINVTVIDVPNAQITIEHEDLGLYHIVVREPQGTPSGTYLIMVRYSHAATEWGESFTYYGTNYWQLFV
jgi:hypothetical protein